MPTHRPPPSDLPLYVGLLFAAGLVVVCLTSFLGTAVVYVFAAGGAVAAIGLAHYLLWGHRMKDANRNDPE
jgi:hypothetical protein